MRMLNVWELICPVKFRKYAFYLVLLNDIVYMQSYSISHCKYIYVCLKFCERLNKIVIMDILISHRNAIVAPNENINSCSVRVP